jgi:hypothetical protein
MGVSLFSPEMQAVFDESRGGSMKTEHLLATAAILFTATVASAETLDNIKPERAPAAQRNAPAEKIAPPMSVGTHKPPETTGQSVHPLELGNGANTQPKGIPGASFEHGNDSNPETLK